MYREALVFELIATLFQFKRAGHSIMPCNELKHGEVALLMALIEHDQNGKRLNASDLSSHMQLSPGAITAVITSLEDKGLVVRENSKEDRRVVYIYLTDKGRERVEKLKQDFSGQIGKMVDFLGLDETKTLISLLKKAQDFLIQQQETV